MASSRQHNTIKAYLGSYRRFEEWVGDIEELSVFPSNELANYYIYTVSYTSWQSFMQHKPIRFRRRMAPLNRRFS